MKPTQQYVCFIAAIPVGRRELLGGLCTKGCEGRFDEEPIVGDLCNGHARIHGPTWSLLVCRLLMMVILLHLLLNWIQLDRRDANNSLAHPDKWVLFYRSVKEAWEAILKSQTVFWRMFSHALSSTHAESRTYSQHSHALDHQKWIELLKKRSGATSTEQWLPIDSHFWSKNIIFRFSFEWPRPNTNIKRWNKFAKERRIDSIYGSTDSIYAVYRHSHSWSPRDIFFIEFQNTINHELLPCSKTLNLNSVYLIKAWIYQSRKVFHRLTKHTNLWGNARVERTSNLDSGSQNALAYYNSPTNEGLMVLWKKRWLEKCVYITNMVYLFKSWNLAFVLIFLSPSIPQDLFPASFHVSLSLFLPPSFPFFQRSLCLLPSIFLLSSPLPPCFSLPHPSLCLSPHSSCFYLPYPSLLYSPLSFLASLSPILPFSSLPQPSLFISPPSPQPLLASPSPISP